MHTECTSRFRFKILSVRFSLQSTLMNGWCSYVGSKTTLAHAGACSWRVPQANDQTVKFKGTFFAPPSKCPVKTHLHQKQPHFRTGGIHAIGISSSFNCISIVFGYLMITNTMQQGMLIDELKTQNNIVQNYSLVLSHVVYLVVLKLFFNFLHMLFLSIFTWCIITCYNGYSGFVVWYLLACSFSCWSSHGVPLRMILVSSLSGPPFSLPSFCDSDRSVQGRSPGTRTPALDRSLDAVALPETYFCRSYLWLWF